ncbi:2-oxoglutarate dehydrogenase complex dihydrolipoyllysine-residue succinyltransferase [Desulfotignum phosphitoxidans]|uniref:Dihydrolipoyllysine-residue succinyltransferase component of 2-oxoglutarate dehydrogenase complex n=1 Tax=Desulfotignum phosphitoxidans DSM 13687 TaxID=1286635 RepID=S0FTJ9_9BACT|nr:2-oxoglutarate dehydrogenase complex dihydrolipoyllysine-residue succinyltransferase [Desulfotignum phosphitoxidans]EMS78020.1 dihydrolipoyllysine-residue succinyltransferase component of 2-oxoglutarate dehydrogenase complex [Desulfotignum phosphitoxidans DSM 13687]
MAHDVKVPSVGESVTEALLVQWLKNDGDTVQADEPLFVIETDKVTLEVTADTGGTLNIKVKEGETVAIGTVVAEIESGGKTEKDTSDTAREQESEPENTAPKDSGPSEKKEPKGQEKKSETENKEIPEKDEGDKVGNISPSARRLAEEKQIDLSDVTPSGPGGRITKGDVLLVLESSQDRAVEPDASEPDKAESDGKTDPETSASDKAEPDKAGSDKGESDQADSGKVGSEERVTRKPMTPIRRKIAEHLLKARQNTAMLTTFNEIDMSRVMALRQAYKEPFKEKHQVSLGFMSFFIKACIEALKQNPQVNAFVDGKDIVYHHYYHVGVAIGSGKGLVVPVIRHADQLDFAGIEKAIVAFVDKIENNRLELADLEGGTFTVSNGGVYGSLLSTPILNSPQSGILGMHKIEKRPVVVDDEVVIRPMMYVALSYDHRIVDGREAVTCLKKIKACVENPERMLLEV